MSHAARADLRADTMRFAVCKLCLGVVVGGWYITGIVMLQYIEKSFRYRYNPLYRIGRLNIDLVDCNAPFLFLKVDITFVGIDAGNSKISDGSGQIDQLTRCQCLKS